MPRGRAQQPGSRAGELPRPRLWQDGTPFLRRGVTRAGPRSADEGSYAFPCVPAGFEPPADISDEPHESCVSPHRQIITSGGSTGRPKLIVDTVPAEIDPDAPSYTVPPGTHVLIPGPMYHAGPFLNCHWTILVGGFVAIMSRFDAETALQYAERAAQLEPGSAHVLDTLGWVLFKVGRAADARDMLQRSIDLEELASNVLHLGTVYEYLGVYDRARDLYEKAIELAETAGDPIASDAREALDKLDRSLEGQ